LRQQGNVFTVKRGNKGAVQFCRNLVGDIIAFVFQGGDHRYPVFDVIPDIQEFF
jgi:hypothetical protein